jgi:hypothetical protein
VPVMATAYRPSTFGGASQINYSDLAWATTRPEVVRNLSTSSRRAAPVKAQRERLGTRVVGRFPPASRSPRKRPPTPDRDPEEREYRKDIRRGVRKLKKAGVEVEVPTTQPDVRDPE